MNYTIQSMIEEHYLKHWGNDPHVTLEGIFNTLEGAAYDTMEELEEDRRVLEQGWNEYFKSGCMVIAPNKELAFLRGLFPCHAGLPAWVHGDILRPHDVSPTYEEMKEQEEEIWRGIFDACRQVYKSIHGRDPVEGLPPIRWCEETRSYIDDPNGYDVHITGRTNE